MKKFWLIAVIILCIATVLGGKIYWNHKIGRISSSNLQSGINTSSGVASDFSLDGSSATINKQISALPKSLQKAASSARKNNGQVQIAMVGSENVQALSLLLQHQLDLTFGDLFFKVTAIDLGQINSLNLNQAKTTDLFKNMSARPDAVIFTPLLYNDNGKVGSGDTETVTGLFEEKIRLQYPKAAFFISLPNYSSDAPYINSRIDSLEAYVTDQKFQNLNYLSKWPKGNTRANLVSSDGHTMNKAGQTVWINYVISQWGLKK
ncbi:hypothetical protein E4665_11925 [Sporolactobacillus shoreae]|uniref:SGNH/GDSL hydrolase family protein n=1 Tax=Sporolactobacillus shoreae TaxID=1465501 RepID=A0A4Z0GMV9_9BACL|nr:hypothetical protein [Sporolactobacillus shoreae]TGA97544.1 hypothetical protein E4665_11925 [Sporolactobacillus shoreae]